MNKLTNQNISSAGTGGSVNENNFSTLCKSLSLIINNYTKISKDGFNFHSLMLIISLIIRKTSRMKLT